METPPDCIALPDFREPHLTRNDLHKRLMSSPMVRFSVSPNQYLNDDDPLLIFAIIVFWNLGPLRHRWGSRFWSRSGLGPTSRRDRLYCLVSGWQRALDRSWQYHHDVEYSGWCLAPISSIPDFCYVTICIWNLPFHSSLSYRRGIVLLQWSNMLMTSVPCRGCLMEEASSRVDWIPMCCFG